MKISYFMLLYVLRPRIVVQAGATVSEEHATCTVPSV